MWFCFFCKQKTAYGFRISDWSSDVCSSDLLWHMGATSGLVQKVVELRIDDDQDAVWLRVKIPGDASCHVGYRSCFYRSVPTGQPADQPVALKFEETEKRSEEHTSELQSLMRISYAVFCLNKKNKNYHHQNTT